MKLRIEVTQRDIDRGCQADGGGYRRGCMVWQAVSRALEGGLYPRVNTDRLSLHESKSDFHALAVIPLDRAVEKRIRAFDKGASVSPFTFELELPDELLQGQAR